MSLETMYEGIAFSPMATLTNNIGAADTVIEVDDISAFPPAPNLATIGTDESAETILYSAKTETALSGCVRGLEGAAKTWAEGTIISRNFTNYDYLALINNILQTVPKDIEGGNAALIKFADNTTFQEKLDNGELKGPQGVAGKTPVKGVDYFTAEDIATIVQSVLAALPLNTALFNRMEGN